MGESRVIEVIGASIGLGGRCTDTAGGPRAIREAGLLARLSTRGPTGDTARDSDGPAARARAVRDLGDLVAADAPRLAGRDPGAALIAEVERFSLALRASVEASLARGALPCVLGGDHSLGAATQAAIGRAARGAGREPPGLLWIDAHTDANTMESTPSGNLHGMMLAAVHGLEVPAFRAVVEGGLRDPRRTVYLGARDIDEEEREIVERLGCRVIAPAEIRARGADAVVAEALAIAGGADGRVSVSFDLDSLDPSIAPGVDCHVPDGLLWEEAAPLLRLVGRHDGVVAIEVVEVNPVADPDGRTARLAVEAAALLAGA